MQPSLGKIGYTRPDTGGQLGGQPRSHILRGVTDAQQRERAQGVTPRHVVGDDWRGHGAVRTLMGEAFPEVFPLPLLWLYLPAVLAVPLGSCFWVFHTPYPRWLDQCSTWSGGATWLHPFSPLSFPSFITSFFSPLFASLWFVSAVAQMVKNLPAVLETRVWFLGREDPLEEGTSTHSSILCLENPMNRGAWQATVYGVAKELETTEVTSHTAHSHNLSPSWESECQSWTHLSSSVVFWCPRSDMHTVGAKKYFDERMMNQSACSVIVCSLLTWEWELSGNSQGCPEKILALSWIG